ncbi:MAG: SCO family protein [Elusimicrobiota bacterium]
MGPYKSVDWKQLLSFVVPALGIWLLAVGVRAMRPPALPEYFKVPEFSMLAAGEDGGAHFTQADLAGKVWIADFIFTRCQGPCPSMSLAMARLQAKLPKEVSFASVSVDPDFDTPQVMSEYARRYAADMSRWIFLTPGKRELYAFMREGLKLPVGENPAEPVGFQIMHSTKFVLIDAKGMVRGYFDVFDDDFYRDIEHAARRLSAAPQVGGAAR